MLIKNMMKRKSLIVILLMTEAGFILNSAQEELSLSLAEAQQFALESNKVVRNAELAVDAAREVVRESLAMGLPQVEANVDYSNFLGAAIEIKFGEDAPVTRIPFKPTSNLGVTVGQLVFSGSYIVGLQTARLYRELAESGYEKTAIDIREQVASAYYTVLVAEESYGIIMKNLENIKDVFDKTSALYSVGMAEVTDVDQMAVQVTALENAAKSAQRQIELSYNLLRLQLGVDVASGIRLTDNLDDILLRIDFETTLAEEFDLEENIDYQMMITRRMMSKKQVELEKMNYLPTISGFYNRTQKILRPDFDMTPPNMIGLQMNLPIFSSGSRKAKLDQARINYQTVQNEMALLTDQLLIQEKQYRYNLRSGLELYVSQKENVAVSQRVYNSINLKYEQGLVSSLDLTTANNNYLQAESSYINALIQLLNAQLELDKLLSNL